jgi:2-oxoglutarate dehydrogenase E2 component (dihydrolipoamide succinyltransferase)
MKIDIKVPSIGESITSARISAILAPSGSQVKEGQEILELETDKVNQMIYAPSSGVIQWSVKVDDEVAIGDTIGTLEAGAAPKKEEVKPRPAPQPAKAALPTPPPAAGSARKTPADFAAEIKAPPSKPQSQAVTKGTRKRMSGLRRTIAQRLVEVKNQTAMLTTFNEVDMSKVIEARGKEKEAFEKRYGVKLGFMSFFVKACVAALKAYPEVGSFIEGDEIVTLDEMDLGLAVSTDKGLFVPVLRKCDTLSFGEIEKKLAELAKRAKEGTINVDDLKGGIFTITNGGVFGSMLSTPILNPPQSAILGMHTIVKRPVVIGDEIAIRPIMYLALSYDHRVIDGKEAVQFLVHIKQSLEDPTRLLLDL